MSASDIIFMTNARTADRKDLEAIEGEDFSYNRHSQISVWHTERRSPTGRHTNQGNDWDKTDESY